MTCREFTDFIDAYLRRELPPSESWGFERHLEVCEPCVNYLETYSQAVELCRGVGDEPDDPVSEEVPDELVRAVLDTVRNRTDRSD